MKVRLDDDDSRIAIEEYLNLRMRGDVTVKEIRRYQDEPAQPGVTDNDVKIEADVEIVEAEEE